MDTGYILHLTAVWPFGAVDVLRGGKTRQCQMWREGRVRMSSGFSFIGIDRLWRFGGIAAKSYSAADRNSA
jgi:hypothetical protein